MSNGTINTQALQAFLDRGIIEVKEWQTTIFDIAGFPHYENVLSNVYAYFMNPFNQHGLGDLFLTSLLKLLESDYHFDVPLVTREFTTAKNNRIDIVVEEDMGASEGSKEKSPYYLIIENKVFHHVNNDFDDYYNHFEVDDSCKKGVLLSLHKTESKHDKFINITHQQWLAEVWSNIGSVLPNLPDETLHHLKQLSKNITNFSMAENIGEYFSFYHKNVESIKNIETIKKELTTYIWKEVGRGVEQLDEFNFKFIHRNNWAHGYYKEDTKEEVFITIVPKIMDDTHAWVEVIIEIGKNGLDKLNELQHLAEYTDKERKLVNTATNGQHFDYGFQHLVRQTLVVDEKNIKDLSSVIVNQIKKEDFIGIYKKVKQYITKINTEKDE